MRLLLCWFILPASLAAGADLSGTWRLDIARSRFDQQAAPRAKVMQVVHREPALVITIEETLSNGKEVSGTSRYTTDGTTTVNAVMGNAMTSVTHWEGDELRMKTTGNFNGNQILLEDRFSLSADRKQLTILRHFEGKQGGVQDQILVHSRGQMGLAKGTFTVKLERRDPAWVESGVGRMSIDKTFGGGLEAASNGEMLSAMGSVKGSVGYVAMERINGVLDGRKGSFVLQHTGTMERGKSQLSVSVVPDSGTDELVGLSGKMTIEITGGKHFYEFAYSLNAN